MKLKVVLIFFLPLNFQSVTLSAQEKPKEIAHYYDRSGPWCHNQLVLSSDHMFFYAGSCENDIICVKGKWLIKKNILYLHNWDSIKSYPRIKVSEVKRNDDTANLAIKVYDYFGNPCIGFGITVLNSMHSDYSTWTDSSGKVLIPRKKDVFYSFYADFQIHHSDASKIDSNRIFDFRNDISEFIIHVDYPESIKLDRGVILVNSGLQYFTIGKDGLYFKKKKVYSLLKK